MFKLAIVGRPNVGKSALFNRICQKRVAIVDEAEGITRDRLYATADFFGHPFEIIDTGGIDPSSEDVFQEEIAKQAEIAMREADSIVMVVDGRIGLTSLDHQLAQLILQMEKRVVLAVNKIDHIDQERLLAPFYKLGISRVVPISAMHGTRIAELLEEAWEGFDFQETPPPEKGISIALIGRPNVGKSTLINRLVGKPRCVVSPEPGTTRDHVSIPFEYDGKAYTLVDTAGIRKKQAEKEVVDKFAAIRTKEALEACDVCLLMLDAREGLSMQDKRIATMIEQSNKGCIVLLNKWDLVSGFRMEHCTQRLRQQAPFLAHCPMLCISAETGRNCETIFTLVQEIYQNLCKRIPTHQLNSFVEKAIQLCAPPMLGGKRLRIYYLTQVTTAPPRFTLFVNYSNLMTESYRRYLMNQFRKHYAFTGVPLNFHLRQKKVTRSDRSERIS